MFDVVKIFMEGRALFNIKKFLELKGVEILEQEIIAEIKARLIGG